MSKTLFNQNTFQTKNVTNSDDITDLKVDTFKATNAILTNITNSELQAATTGVATNTTAIAGFNTSITANTTAIATNTTAIATNTTAIAGKQDALSTGDGIDITGTTISFDGIISGDITTSGTITGNVMNYVDGGVVTNIKTQIESKQDTLTDGDNAGSNISISGSQVISATNTTYTAASNGGLSLSGTEFSLDFSNTNSSITIPQEVLIENTTSKLKIAPPNSGSGVDSIIEIQGRRSGTAAQQQAQILFENFDTDLSDYNILGEISGMVSDHTNNYGGLIFCNYADGSTRTGALTMSSGGNFNMGNGKAFQNDYKLKINGSTHLSGMNYIKPQLRLFSFDPDDLDGTEWGNGSLQNNIETDRRLGESFCSTSAGIITLTKNGYYRIRVSAKTQSDDYNDRLSFMSYLRINSTDYDEEEDYDFFGWTYIRNETDGGHGSVSFQDYIFLSSGDEISVRHKLETTSDRNFDNTLPRADIDNFLNLQIERIYDTDPEE